MQSHGTAILSVKLSFSIVRGKTVKIVTEIQVKNGNQVRENIIGIEENFEKIKFETDSLSRSGSTVLV